MTTATVTIPYVDVGQQHMAIREELLGKQRNDGSWLDPICVHYGTAMACIILQIPNNYLPILQK